ncbi:MAG: O-antigen ligase family protein [Bacteroidales bacterium]|nr:O-antigen ligase family protein [Bacteroidales bacterium]
MGNANEIKKYSYISLIAGLWLIYEAGYGVSQVFGLVHSKHVLFPMTGHFQNPGPFGGFVAMLMSVCLGFILLTERNDNWQRWVRRLCFVAAAMGVVVLPASLSRAGWLGLVVSLGVLVYQDKRIKGWFQAKSIRISGTLLILSAVCVGGFFLKRDSALGRVHVWHMELLALYNAPLTGAGSGHFAWTYGETQAAYFAAAERAPWEIRVAGCPEYAFNEYLKAGVEWGIPGLLLFLGLALFVCIILVRKANPLGYGAITLSVFAFFSYPLELWQFRLMGGLFVAAALGECLGRYGWAAYGFFLLAVGAIWIEGRHRTPPLDYRSLYRQGYALFQQEAYEEALPLLSEGASLSCDPMFHNIMGRCYEAIGEYKAAEFEYWHAHYMVPCRLYPLVLLQELYISQGEMQRADETLSRIKALPLNPKNANMKKLRERAEENAVRQGCRSHD